MLSLSSVSQRGVIRPPACSEDATLLNPIFLGSLLATRLLLPVERVSENIVAFGAGAQIQTHLTLFLTAYPSIRSCTIFNRSLGPRVEELLVFMLWSFPYVKTTVAALSHDDKTADANLREAVGRADIIVAATPSTAPLFPSEYVRPGTHLCLIGSYKPEMWVIGWNGAPAPSIV